MPWKFSEKESWRPDEVTIKNTFHHPNFIEFNNL